MEQALQTVLGCGPDTAQRIAAKAQARRHPPARVIVRQGDVVAETWLLLDGRARSQHVTAEGRQVPIHDLVPGDLFGALDAMLPEQSAEVVAIEAAFTALMRCTDFLALLEQHSVLGVALSRSLLRRLNLLADAMIARVTLSVTGRIHAELLRRAQAGGGRISPPPVLAQMAADLDTSRETVSRAISALERRGIVRRGADALELVAPARLEAMIV
jgi:CRP-like cAMP-binding protein